MLRTIQWTWPWSQVLTLKSHMESAWADSRFPSHTISLVVFLEPSPECTFKNKSRSCGKVMAWFCWQSGATHILDHNSMLRCLTFTWSWKMCHHALDRQRNYILNVEEVFMGKDNGDQILEKRVLWLRSMGRGKHLLHPRCSHGNKTSRSSFLVWLPH